MKNLIFAAALMVALNFSPQTRAQSGVPPVLPAEQLPMSGVELDQLVGSIALYPDPLIAQMLPAAAQPAQLVLAYRYISAGGDPNQIDAQTWDASVKAMARYPSVLKWMDDNLAWTTALGQAFLTQQQDVMDSIQRLRAQAQDLGNLQSSPQETVVSDDGCIEINPADPNLVYVPNYDPGVIYYQRPYGSAFMTYGAGIGIGAWFDHDFDWHNHNILVWDRTHPRPVNWWRTSPAHRTAPNWSRPAVWQAPRGPVGVHTDRGWVNRDVHEVRANLAARETERRGTVATIGQHTGTVAERIAPAPAGPQRRGAPTVIGQRGGTVAQRVASAPAAPAHGALIGVHSAAATQQFSNRGAQSRQVVVHAAAPAHAGGGGGRRR